MTILYGLIVLSMALFGVGIGDIVRQRFTQKSSTNPLGVASFIYLLHQSIGQFVRRLGFILIQVMVFCNGVYGIYIGITHQSMNWLNLIALDVAILFFSGIVFLLLRLIPQALDGVINHCKKTVRQGVFYILYAGIINNISFFASFLALLGLSIAFLDHHGLIALSMGIVVVSFYTRVSGGAYKAATENGLHDSDSNALHLTHPTRVLKSSAAVIAAIGGVYVDIFGSWFLAICSFFVYLVHAIEPPQFLDLLEIPEVQWVLLMVGYMAIAMVIVLIASRFNLPIRNIFLDMGYAIAVITFVLVVITAVYLNMDYTFIGMICGVFVVVLGIIFFTNYLISGNHQPIQFIAKQAQYGASNSLISSFFNGLMANAVVLFVVIMGVSYMVATVGTIGLIMGLVYGLSIIVVACTLTLFSLLSYQVTQLVDTRSNPAMQPIITTLLRLSGSLDGIGNTLSTLSGVITGVLLLTVSVSILNGIPSVMSVSGVIGFGLGVIITNVFYAVSISGTYGILRESSAEIQRQLVDIPYLDASDKTHPNTQRLCDRHAINALRAVTIPGIWVISAVGILWYYLPIEGIYSVLVGIIVTAVIYSFFWSVFGDSVMMVAGMMRQGRFGGQATSIYRQIQQAFLYAHYFQWVLVPSGVILMKLAGIIALVVALSST
jgi:hypothetical protein